MKKLKKAIIVLLALCMISSLTACGKIVSETVIALVQGNIDAIYLGKFDENYLKLVDSTKAESQKIYQDGLELEAEYFSIYWGIIDPDYESFDDLDEDLKNSIIELYKEIYKNSKYEVLSAAKQDEGSFSVKVSVEPINIMELATDIYTSEEYEPLNDFWNKYVDVDIYSLSDDEYMDYTNEYGRIVVQLVKEQLPNLGYIEQKTQSIQVELVDDLWTINEDDWAIFDSYVIYYP